MKRFTTSALALVGSVAAISVPVSAQDLSGELTVYSNVAPQIQEAINNAFMEANPGVTITLRRLSGSSGEADTVYVTEAMSGGSPADILFGATPVPIEDNPDLFADLADAGVKGLDSWPESARSDKYVVTMDGLWAVGYDTSKVAAEDVPESWQDLLNPAFADNCVMLEMRGKNPGLVTWARTMRERFGDEFLQGIADLNCQVTDTGQLAGQLLAAGGAAIGFPFFPSHVNPSKAAGAPVEYQLISDPVVAAGKYISLPANAPHKELAAAMMTWFLTPQGQEAACGDGTYSSPLQNVPGCVSRPADAEVVTPYWQMTDDEKEELAALMGIGQ